MFLHEGQRFQRWRPEFKVTSTRRSRRSPSRWEDIATRYKSNGVMESKVSSVKSEGGGQCVEFESLLPGQTVERTWFDMWVMVCTRSTRHTHTSTTHPQASIGCSCRKAMLFSSLNSPKTAISIEASCCWRYWSLLFAHVEDYYASVTRTLKPAALAP